MGSSSHPNKSQIYLQLEKRGWVWELGDLVVMAYFRSVSHYPHCGPTEAAEGEGRAEQLSNRLPCNYEAGEV
jgi:hypothetical protein